MLAGYIADRWTRHNAIHSLVDGMFWSLMMGFTQPFVGVFAIFLGAGDYLVGLLSSLPALVMLLSYPLAAELTERPARSDGRPAVAYRRVTLVSTFIHRAFYLVFAAIPWLPLPGNQKAVLFVVLFGLASLPATVTATSWTSLMGQLFPDHLRGRVFGERNAYTTLAMLVASAAAGWWLDQVPGALGFSILFAASFAALMASLYYLAKLEPVPPDDLAGLAEAAQERRAAPGLSAWLEVIRDSSFMQMAGASAIMHLGLQLPVSLYTILFVRVLELPTSWIGAFSVINGITTALTSPFWGRVADRRGHAAVVVYSMMLFGIFPVLYGFVRSPWLISVLMATAGVALAGFNLSHFNWLLSASPPDRRPHYLGVYNVLISLPAFIGPVLGVAVYRWLGTNDQQAMLPVFVMATMLRLAGSVIFHRRAHRASASLPARPAV